MNTKDHALWVREPGSDTLREAQPHEIVKAAKSVVRIRKGQDCSSPQRVKDYLVTTYAQQQYETFGCLWLNRRHRLIYLDVMFRGTIDGATVHPREVLRDAIKHNAAAVILFHNHPSGNPSPSQPDELITTRLKEVLALIDVRVIDHFIVGGDQCTSFAELGRL